MPRKPYHQLKWADRIRMETLLRKKHTLQEVAEELGVHVSTVYREYARGLCTQIDTELVEHARYLADVAQRNADWEAENKGRPLKIGNDRALLDRLDQLMLEKKLSPEAALAQIEKEEEQFKTKISFKTLYRYIDEGLLNTKNENLPVKGNRKRKKKAPRPTQKRDRAGTGIEKRPEEVADRETAGHWEMDTVKGKKSVTKGCLLVLTERKTREEIIFYLRDQKADSVVKALDELEAFYGEAFQKIFRSITVDNGVEFANCEGMERSILMEGKKRVPIYYCHPYSSFERGSNENNNRMVRRWIPKGVDFDGISREEVQKLTDWINNYPRRSFGFKSSAELWAIELAQLQAS